MRPDYVVEIFLRSCKACGINTIDEAIAHMVAVTNPPRVEPEIQSNIDRHELERGLINFSRNLNALSDKDIMNIQNNIQTLISKENK